MPKLQRITRTNGSQVHVIVIPKEIVEQAEFQKGDDLKIEFKEKGLLEVRK